jgi:hypothetical protein
MARTTSKKHLREGLVLDCVDTGGAERICMKSSHEHGVVA